MFQDKRKPLPGSAQDLCSLKPLICFRGFSLQTGFIEHDTQEKLLLTNLIYPGLFIFHCKKKLPIGRAQTIRTIFDPITKQGKRFSV